MARKDSKKRNLHIGESQRKDGLYMYRYVDLNGRRKTIYANDLSDLRIKEKAIQRDIDAGITTDGSIKKFTVNMLFERYLQSIQLTGETRINYQRLWDLHVKDALGDIRVTQLRPSHVKLLYSALSNEGLSYNTIDMVHTILCPCLEMAVDDDIIRKNPARKAMSKEYGKEPKEKVALTRKQQDALLSFIQKSNCYNVYHPMFKILLGTALRCGELIGLCWDNLDREKRELRIDHQLIYKNLGCGCKFYISPPKTDAGVRVIPLTESVYDAFAEQMELNNMLGRQCVVEIDGYSDFIFLAKTGRPIMPSAVNNVIYNVIAAYNKEESRRARFADRPPEFLPKFSVHALRHTACTTMAQNGLPMKTLQYVMGHAKADVTMNVYAHIGDLAIIKADLERLEGFLEAQ